MSEPDTGTVAPIESCEINLEYSDRVTLAIQQHGVPLVDGILITNRSDKPIDDVTITVSLENDECVPWSRHLSRLDPLQLTRVEPDTLALTARQLASRTEAERTRVIVELSTSESRCRRGFPIDVLPFDQWPGVGHLPEISAAFVTPNHALIAELLTVARGSLRGSGESDALDGYQSGSRKRSALLAEACFHALSSRQIGYSVPPASFETSGQRIRLIDRVWRESAGTCLDLSFALASMFEQCGLNTLILLPHGHAMPAIWTHDTHLPEVVIDEPARIRNLIELGEIVPIESTHVTQSGTSFSGAVEAARSRLGNPGATFCAIDIRAARKHGVRPLPLRDSAASTEVDLSAVDHPSAPTESNTSLRSIELAERAEQRVDADVVDESGDARIARWQTRLLDLSLRNRLLNYRETARAVPLQIPDLATFEDLLAGGETFNVRPKSDGDDSFFGQEIRAGRIYAATPQAETQRRLLNIFRTSKASIEETGANLLHLALGLLKWFESDSSEQPRYAPLILLPVTLTRASTGTGYMYSLALSDEPLRPNVTLLEKLRTQFGIETAGLDNLPEDESGIDVPLILRSFRQAIRHSSRWEVVESAHIGLFSFNKFLMWRDLKDHLKQLKESRLVRHLVDRPGEDFDSEPFPRAEELDDTTRPHELYCTRDADSTQLAAVQAAANDRTFVLEGPPGTGKSQTIANIIADSLARGKRVLFVAEKMAALTVVRRRLNDDGIGDYCLELHSAKASKKEVLKQLETALDAAAVTEPSNWKSICQGLDASRTQLNAYVRELHRRHATGDSLYKALGRIATLGDGPMVGLPTEQVGSTTEEQLNTWRLAIIELLDRSKSVDPVYAHPLRGIGRVAWEFGLNEQAEEAIRNAESALGDLSAALEAFSRACAIETAPGTLPRDGVIALIQLASLLPESPAPARRLLLDPEATESRQVVRRAAEAGRARNSKRDDLLKRYREEFIDIDHLAYIDQIARAQKHPSLIRLLTGRKARGKLRVYCKGATPSLEVIAGDLEAARECKRLTGDLKGMTDAAMLLGTRWNNADPDWDAVDAMLVWCEKFGRIASALRRVTGSASMAEALADAVSSPEAMSAVVPTTGPLVRAWNAWAARWDTLKSLLMTSHASAIGTESVGWLGRMAETLTRWRGSLSELNNWCSWHRAHDSAVQAGLTDLVARYDSGELARDQIRPSFERTFARKWFNAVANQSDVIREFNADSHTQLVRNFRDQDRSLIDMTKAVVGGMLSDAAPTVSSYASEQSEVGILRRELAKKRRHLPTRRLIESMPNLLPKLKPCFLMSPLSVAQFLDPSLPPFDLVVFDEASQIPVWDSIGAIARGKEVIVVGDSKQLPPTAFFSTVDAEDEFDAEDNAVEDMESILKECNASGIPSLDLRWHYRSRHESLIAFSNHHYYKNRLHTFPSPEDRSASLGVTLRHIPNGVYDRGGSRTNRIEAEAVVNEVVSILKRPEHTDSIGIVTFNQTQQVLIEDLFDQMRRDHPEIERFFTNEVPEPVFIKNLENVQGDERDTIIFSVGYGPDQTGRPSMNFGPLNKDGGERRLNVAVTRARKRLVVFSSLTSDQIDLRRSRAVGVRHFKQFLDYAQRGPQALVDAISLSGDREFDSEFEHAVWSALVDRGWEVDTQVGCAGYRIDLGVRDPDRPGRYILGIECDGASYHSAKTARDRDRLRQSILEGLGWRIARVWSTEWLHRRDKCLARLDEQLDDAKRHVQVADMKEGANAISVASVPPEPRSDDEATTETMSATASDARDGLARYRIAGSGGLALTTDDFFDTSEDQTLVGALVHIVRAEEPITEELALRRLASWAGIQRVTERCRDRYRWLERKAIKSGAIVLHDAVLWSRTSTPESFVEFRVPDEDPATRRDLEHIPLVELSNAAIHILDLQFGLPAEELQREIARLFGVQRVTARALERTGAAVEHAVATGAAKIENGIASRATSTS